MKGWEPVNSHSSYSTPERVFRIAIIEDHLLQRQRTEELVGAQHDLQLVFSGESAPEFVAWLRATPPQQHPHLLLLDLIVDRQRSVDVALVSALLNAGLRIVVLSALASPPLVREIVRAGVNAVVGKRDSEDDILAAIRAAAHGEQWMTTDLASVIAGDSIRPKLSIQEERALILYASGLTIDDVASSMNVKPDTAKQYIDRVRAKYTSAGYTASTKLDLSRIAWVDGYIEPKLLPSAEERTEGPDTH